MADATSRTTLRQAPLRGFHDRSVITEILDEGYLCHVGVIDDDSGDGGGAVPVVVPTLYARLGDHVVFHGSPASRLLRRAKGGQVCLTVTLIDGFVLGRSTFHHSMNFRSVMIFGSPEPVPDDEKATTLDTMVERLAPGRVDHVRPMHEREVRATLVLRLPIDEASAKIRTGGPVDDEEDYDLPVWAGVIPVTTAYGRPEVDPAMRVAVPTPTHVTRFRRPTG
jgi:nitroimidazol reductase NimA-like FMN-containing flavoprotein (pyridoxamine 5'-phosphate oxidase superfamily)